MKNNIDGGPIKKDLTELELAINDAYKLLKFATTRGMDISNETSKTIIAAKWSLTQNSITPEVEADFWPALRELGARVCPVTIETLEICESKSISNAQIFAYLFALFAGLILLTTLAANLYYSSGVSALEELTLIRSELTSTNYDAKILAPLSDDDANSTSPVNVTDNTNADTTIRLARLEAANRTITKLISLWILSKPIPAPAVVNPEDVQTALEDATLSMVRSAALEMQMKVIVAFFGVSILPLLYGMLGASVFILRSITKEFKDRVLSTDSITNHLLRILLGALSGLTVAWVIVPPSSYPTGSTISAFTLAFVAGYSVEIFFSALDKLVGTFTHNNPTISDSSVKS